MLNIQIEIIDDRMALPAVRSLANLSETTLIWCRAHKSRPPLGIYLTSINQCVKRMLPVLSRVSDAKLMLDLFADKAKEDLDLTESYDTFLDALMEHTDDCLNVLLCFFPDKGKRDQHPSVKKYKKEISGYRNHIGALVNHIKHGQGRLRLTAIKNKIGFVPGYFVEGIMDDQVLGTVVGIAAEIHRDGNRAFSFHRDLRYHFANLCAVSEALRTAVEEITGVVSENKSTSWGDPRLTTLASGVSNLPKIVFRHELRLDWPRISLTPPMAPGDLRLLKIEFPCAYEHLKTLKGDTKEVWKYVGDGVTNAFWFPPENA